jgi:hypothetical protein
VRRTVLIQVELSRAGHFRSRNALARAASSPVPWRKESQR